MVNWLWYITNEELISVTLAIGNTYEDDVRGNDLGAGCLSIDNRSESMKWREMKGNVELLDMCMCIVFAFQLIRAKEVRIDIEVKRSEEKWREVMTCDVSPVAMFRFLHTSGVFWYLVIRIWVDSIAVSVFADIFIELTNTVSDGKIQMTILILRRGALSSLGTLFTQFDQVLKMTVSPF